MPRLHIVLVEPEIPQNTGNVARTCAVTGAAPAPGGAHGLYPPTTKSCATPAWITGSTWISPTTIAFPSFFEKNQGAFYFFSTKAQNRYCDVQYPENCYLFFGKESAGLPEELLFHNRTAACASPCWMKPGA